MRKTQWVTITLVAEATVNVEVANDDYRRLESRVRRRALAGVFDPQWKIVRTHGFDVLVRKPRLKKGVDHRPMATNSATKKRGAK